MKEHGRCGRSPRDTWSYLGSVAVDIGQRRSWRRSDVLIVPSDSAPRSPLGASEGIGPVSAISMLSGRIVDMRCWSGHDWSGGRRAAWRGVCASGAGAGFPRRRAWRDIAADEGFYRRDIFVYGCVYAGRRSKSTASRAAGGSAGCRGRRESRGNGRLRGAGGSEGGLQRPRGVCVCAVYGHVRSGCGRLEGRSAGSSGGHGRTGRQWAVAGRAGACCCLVPATMAALKQPTKTRGRTRRLRCCLDSTIDTRRSRGERQRPW